MLHLLAMGFPVGYLLLPEPWGLSIMIGLSVTALSLDWLRAHHRGSHAFFERFFGFMMRTREREVLKEGPVFNGATWVAVSFTVLILVFPTDVAIISFIMFMMGDASAALVGRSIGRTPWLREGATVEGSVAFALFGALTGWLLISGVLPWPSLSAPLHAVLIACAAAAVLEASPLPFNDNLSVPVGAAIVMTGIMTLWPS